MLADEMFRPVKRPKTQALDKARGILERQHERGLETLKAPWAQKALAAIDALCPNLAWEDKVRLFHDRKQDSAESVVQAALFAEWNRVHGKKK